MRFCTVLFLAVNLSPLIAQSLPLLLLVSFDGFRHDYPRLHGPLKNFQRLAERGVHARNMISAFTTATFPNHYSLVTGLYEEVHGVVSNHMYDRKSNLIFDPPAMPAAVNWWPYPAIWTVNEQREGARSGVASWPQDPIPLRNYQAYTRTRPKREIIDQILRWFNDPVDPINFGAIYFDEPDLTGHRTGPYSANMTAMVQECDAHLGYLLDRIESNKHLRENLHLLVVSDHGMEQINGTENPIYIEDYIDGDHAQAYGVPPAMNIFVRSPKEIEMVRKKLLKVPHAKVYRREEIPERFHYRNHERIGDLFLLFEPGYEMVHDPAHDTKRRNYSATHGNHGYDNQVDSMKGIFYASGPKLRTNYTLENSSVLYNIDLFNLMCIILNIDHCPASNGTLRNIQPFLRKREGIVDKIVFSILWIGLGIVVLSAIIWSTFALRNLFKKESPTETAYIFSSINSPKVTTALETK